MTRTLKNIYRGISLKNKITRKIVVVEKILMKTIFVQHVLQILVMIMKKPMNLLNANKILKKISII